MSDMIERNTYLELHDKDGKIERHYPITKFKNIEDVPTADKDNASFVPVDNSISLRIVLSSFSR